MQLPLFGKGDLRSFVASASLDRLRRIELGRGAWLDYAPGWFGDHHTLFEQLLAEVRWQAQRRVMYERIVDVPRLVAEAPGSGSAARLLRVLARELSKRYAWRLNSISLSYYRDGNDSVAPHGDKLGPLVHDSIVCILSVGEPRRFTLRATHGKKRLSYQLGWGDLLVMGGTCQSTFLHGVPKVPRAAPRISIMFRPTVTPGIAATSAPRSTKRCTGDFCD